MGEEFGGDSTYNMSIQTLKRIDTLLIAYHQLKQMGFYKGNPLYNDILAIENSLYVEIRPQLKDNEKNIGDAYRSIFKMYLPPNNKKLITFKDNITEVQEKGLVIMDEWMDWMMDMLYSHKMLMAIGDDPGDVIE